MRAIRIFSLLIILTLAVLLGMKLGPRFRSSTQASRQNSSAKTNSPHASTKTNPPTTPPDGFYLGKGDQKVFVNYATPDPVLRSFIQSVMDGSTDAARQGREIFMRLCAACHQPDGEGKLGLAPPLVGSEWALTPAGGRMVRIVLNGLTGPVHVRDLDWNLTMLPWRENLTDDQIAVVLTYVRTQLGTNHAGPVTSEFVAAVRKETHTALETPVELMGISDP